MLLTGGERLRNRRVEAAGRLTRGAVDEERTSLAEGMQRYQVPAGPAWQQLKAGGVGGSSFRFHSFSFVFIRFKSVFIRFKFVFIRCRRHLILVIDAVIHVVVILQW